MRADRAVLRERLRQHGLGLVLLGADPLRPAKRVNPGARYRAMERFFAASGTAAAGAAMMTSTASVQVNVDAGPRDGWAARVRLAHALGPTMIAISANSPLLGGQVLRLAQHPAAGLEPTRLGAVRPHPRCQRRRPGQRLVALRAARTGHAGPRIGSRGRGRARDGVGAVRRLGRRHEPCSMGVVPRRPTWTTTSRRCSLRCGRAVSWRSDIWTACPIRCGLQWCSPSSRCSTIPSRPTSPRRPPSRSPRSGIAPPACGLGDRRLHAAAVRCVQAAAERAPAELERRHVSAARPGRAGPQPRRRLLRSGGGARHRLGGRRSWRRIRLEPSRPARTGAHPSPRAHAAAGRLRRRRTVPAVRPADEPTGLGPRPHRLAGGTVAAARQRSRTAWHVGTTDRALLRRLLELARQQGRPAAALAG